MAGENFVGGVNALYNRLDRNTRANLDEMNPQNFEGNLLKLDLLRSRVREDQDVKNALAGVQGMEDVYNAVPQVIKGSPVTGMNLLESLSNTNSRSMDREVLARQRQTKMLQDAYSMLSSLEDEPDVQVRAQQYPSMLRQVASIYPEIIPYVGRTIPTQYDPNWSSMTVKSLTPVVERLKMGMQKPYEVKSGENIETYQPVPGGRKLVSTAPRKLESEQKDSEISIFNKALDDRYNKEFGRPPSPSERLEEWNKNKVAMTGDKAKAVSEGKVQAIDQNAVDYVVSQIKAGAPPPMGRGQDFMKTVYSKLNKELMTSGENPENIAAARNVRKSLDSSLAMQEKSIGMMGGFVKNLDKQINRTKDVSNDLVSRVGVRVLDVPLRQMKTRFIGSGEEQILEAYMLEISNEIGKLSTGSQASIAELSVGAQEKWSKIHDPNLSLRELNKILSETRDMGHMRLESSIEARNETRQALTNIGSLTNGTAYDSPPLSAFKNVPEGQPIRSKKTGQVWMLKDGKPVRMKELEGQ